MKTSWDTPIRFQKKIVKNAICDNSCIFVHFRFHKQNTKETLRVCKEFWTKMSIYGYPRIARLRPFWSTPTVVFVFPKCYSGFCNVFWPLPNSHSRFCDSHISENRDCVFQVQNSSELGKRSLVPSPQGIGAPKAVARFSNRKVCSDLKVARFLRVFSAPFLRIFVSWTVRVTFNGLLAQKIVLFYPVFQRRVPMIELGLRWLILGETQPWWIRFVFDAFFTFSRPQTSPKLLRNPMEYTREAPQAVWADF